MTAPSAADYAHWEARDLRMVSIHEWSHFHVARHLGVMGHVRIEKNDRGGDAERFFGGRFHFWQRSNARASTLIALAGTCAEMLVEEPVIQGWQIYEWLNEGTVALSDTDAKLAGDYSEGDIEASLAIVQKTWQDINRDAELEISWWRDEA